MTAVVAYDMYLECSEGKLDETWKLVDEKGNPNPVDFHVFRETLARQMLGYDPKKCKYMGDEKFRDSTKQVKAKRARSPVPQVVLAEDGTAIPSTAAGVTAGSLMACDAH